MNVTHQMSKKWSQCVWVISSNKTLTNTQSRNGIFSTNSTDISLTETRLDNSNLKNNLAF
jgi:hypothetical protein